MFRGERLSRLGGLYWVLNFVVAIMLAAMAVFEVIDLIGLVVASAISWGEYIPLVVYVILSLALWFNLALLSKKDWYIRFRPVYNDLVTLLFIPIAMMTIVVNSAAYSELYLCLFWALLTTLAVMSYLPCEAQQKPGLR